MTMAAMPAIFFIDVPLVVDCRPSRPNSVRSCWFASRRCDLLNAALRLSAGLIRRCPSFGPLAQPPFDHWECQDPTFHPGGALGLGHVASIPSTRHRGNNREGKRESLDLKERTIMRNGRR
jgi:hypothetical protein